MNIRQAKEQVKYAVTAYLSKDSYGEYRIPIERQRPVFLMGPPGVGKTEIMSQIADEMGIALVSYSMTHHTRQSALGLPFISEKNYDGAVCRTTEYTMSEIIASVYDVMEATGKREGILFLDEINCISETLAPSMLQFLQFKTFGRHRVPDGWVIVTAGNPPEYNSSVRDFDLATMDRLKRIDVEPDYKVWREYAENEGIHSAVLTYLDIRKDDFYSVQMTVDGREFVTARGWVDLSEMMQLYELNQIPVTKELISQYVHDDRIARDFSAYYDLFYRFRNEYDIKGILSGRIKKETVERASDSAFDERLTVIRLITDSLMHDFREVSDDGRGLKQILNRIKSRNRELADGTREEAVQILDDLCEEQREEVNKDKAARSISSSKIRVSHGVSAMLSEIAGELQKAGASESNVDVIRRYLAARQAERKERAGRAGERLSNAFHFIESAYGDNEMLIFVTTLTENRSSAEFIATYGSKEYKKYNKNLLLYEREQDLMDKIQEMDE